MAPSDRSHGQIPAILRNAEVLLDGGKVAAVGRALTVTPGTRLLDVQDQLVLPGLIQGHIHLGQTFFRGLAESRRLLEWLKERIWPLEAAHDDESAYWCTLLGAAECLLGGTTTIQDIGIGPGVRGYLRALVDSRLRAVAGQCLMDVGDGLPQNLCYDTDDVLSETEQLGDEFDGANNGRLQYAINPRFILSGSDELWKGVQSLSSRRGWPVHTHALEQRAETELVRSLKQGRDEIEYFADYGILDTDFRVAHGVWLESRHLQDLSRRKFSVVHCPSSNLKLGSGVADVVGLRSAGIPVGVGCDATACSNRLDGFEELRLAALLQMERHGPEAFSGRDALDLATREGAEAIGAAQSIGTLEAGKRADLVVLDASQPELWAASQADLHDIVAFGASRAQVRHVFVDGEHLVEDGKLTHLDLEAVSREAHRACQRLLARSGVEL
ncbi:MAG: amidohydrolase family protein [Acidobacteriota bacterium]